MKTKCLKRPGDLVTHYLAANDMSETCSAPSAPRSPSQDLTVIKIHGLGQDIEATVRCAEYSCITMISAWWHPAQLSLQPARSAIWDRLGSIFPHAFPAVQPFGDLDGEFYPGR